MNSSRFPELDALRGLAILFMIIFHLYFDLTYFYSYSLPLNPIFLNLIGRTSAILFLLLVGISLKLKYYKINLSFLRRQESNHKSIIHDSSFIIQFLPFLTRGLLILSFAFLITFLTKLFLLSGTIYFGILHLIGVSTILAYPFLKFKNLNLLLASIIFTTPSLFNFLLTTHNSPLITHYSQLTSLLGLSPPQLFMLDYYPIFPWFGLILLGVWLASHLYSPHHRQFSLPKISQSSLIRILSLAGRHSLPIYLLHQPIILAFIYLLF